MNNYKPDGLLVMFEPSNGEDKHCLVVGRECTDDSIKIVNSFYGKEALELYEKLITVNSKEETR